MLTPKQTKYRKWQKGRRRNKGVSQKGTKLSFGSFGLKAQTRSWINSRQIESARRVLTRFTQKGGKIWIRIFPHKPKTKKGSEVPMGKGKGSVDHYIADVKPGKIIFEIDGVTEEMAKEAFRKASHKLSAKTKFIIK